MRVYRKETTEADFDFSLSAQTKGQHGAGFDSDSEEQNGEAGPQSGKQEGKAEEGEGVNDTMQTFVFSATLSKDLQRNLKKRGWGGGGAGGTGGRKGKEVASTLGR